MRRWLAAASVSAAVLPCAALVLHGHWLAGADADRARGALADLVVDAPESPSGLVEGYGPLMDRLGSARGFASSGPVIAGPVLLEAGDRRALGRGLGVAAGEERLVALAPLVVSGDLGLVGQGDDALALGVGLARRLAVSPGAEVTLLSLAPGPAALGARRRGYRVAALLRSGLLGFDETAAILRLAAARDLFAPGDAVSGLEARLSGPMPAEAAVEAARRALSGRELRVRHRSERDWPGQDAAAFHGLGRSLLLTALVVAALALALGIPYSRRRGLGVYLRAAAPVTLLALVMGTGAGLLLTAPGFAAIGQPPGGAVPELVRLTLALCLALLLAPALSGRVRGVAASAALATAVALATASPATATVLASLGRRAAAETVEAARAAARIVGPSSVDALVVRGMEVAPARLLGLDPTGADQAKLLRVLTDRPAAASLRARGSRPAPWSPDPGLDDLLEDLAVHGSRVPGTASGGEGPPGLDGTDAARSTSKRPEAEPSAGIVLGAVLARRVGAEVGDAVLVAAAPVGLDTSGTVRPPLPRTFRVAGIARLGLRSVDDQLALADSFQVEALGGRAAAGSARRPELRGLEAAASAAAPFEARARRGGAAGVVQILLLALLLGAIGARGGLRGLATLAAWIALGVAAGGVLGLADAARGAVGLGEASLYEVAPHGRALLTDSLGLWSLLPGLAALAAAALGLAFRGRLGLETEARQRGGQQ